MRREYASLSQGLVAAWCPSVRGSGYVLPDCGGANNAIITAATWQPMTGGMTLAFNGTSSVVSNSSVQNQLNGASVASQSMWLWKSAANTTAASGFSNSPISTPGNRFGAIWFSDGNVYVICENGSAGFASFSNNVAGWMHLAFVFDGSQSTALRVRAFANGTERSLAPFNVTNLSSSLGAYTIGKDSADRFSAGRADDVRLYNRALTQQEIRLLSTRRGIGLTPYRQRRPSLLTQFWTNVGGTWKTAKPWINVGGTWKQGSPKLRTGGAWKG